MIEINALASGSRGNCYYVTDGIAPVLLECGMPYKEIQKRLNFRASEIAACLVSHEHQDHTKAVKDIMKAGIDCYMSQGTADALRLSGHRLKKVKALELLRIGSWAAMPFEAIHDAAEPLNFLLASGNKKLVYLTDTAYCPYRFRGLTHIMVECNHSWDILRANAESGTVPAAMKRRVMKNHMSLSTVKGFLQANDLSQVREIWLLHLSDGNSDADRFKREVQELTGRMVFVA